jgi:hypothetical protein
MPITVNHSTPADGTFSATGATAWDANHTLTGVGTLAEQNANAVAITGGTINGTTVGSTTPSTVNATTLSGQTGVLRGTGQNLVVRSQEFDDAIWIKTNSSVTANATTAPDGTNTADKLVEAANTASHFVAQDKLVAGFTFNISISLKKAERDFALISNGVSHAISVDLVNGTAVNALGTTTNIVVINQSNGWYRVSFTVAALSTNFNIYTSVDGVFANRAYAGNGTSGIFLWGAQIELSTTANTYIPTTTTAIYGTPTLSFSGVSEIGLQSNGALFLQPAGTGAIQAQATTSTTAGGNVRGANAVDWQTSRGAASNVASGQQSVIGGGNSNTASTTYTTVAGGNSNTASGFGSSVLGGNANTSSGIYSAIGGGGNNAVSNLFGYIGGGNLNTAAGYFNFIGGGYLNSGTSGSAVTTQSGTMNATTAVTLSGSNANIKVGQYITGTSIATHTYVAAISGTSLTLSQNASGSSTSTLSFFTPHGVVVGGGNNQATGSYSFIGGGGDAGTAANRNVASGDWSFVGSGRGNTASGIGSFVGGGGLDGSSSALGNTASGTASFIGGGLANGASGTGSSILGGYQHIANSSQSSVLGGRFGTTRGITGNFVFPINAIADSGGLSQSALLVLGVQTTDATATALRSTQAAASTTNQVILPNNSAYFFRGEVVSGVTGGGNTKGWTIEGVIKRGANAASTALVGTPQVVSSFADVGAATWAIAVTADTTNGGIRVTFTGQAATTIRTVCQIRTTEMTY